MPQAPASSSLASCSPPPRFRSRMGPGWVCRFRRSMPQRSFACEAAATRRAGRSLPGSKAHLRLRSALKRLKENELNQLVETVLGEATTSSCTMYEHALCQLGRPSDDSGRDLTSHRRRLLSPNACLFLIASGFESGKFSDF